MPGIVLGTLSLRPVLTTLEIGIIVSMYQKKEAQLQQSEDNPIAKIYKASKWRRWGSNCGLACTQVCCIFCISSFGGIGVGKVGHVQEGAEGIPWFSQLGWKCEQGQKREGLA